MQARVFSMRKLETLKNRGDFVRVRDSGVKWVSAGLILQACANNGRGRRYGLTVSRRVSHSAVRRNRVKRRLRSLAREILPEYGHDDTDYVLIGRRDTATLPYNNLKRDLKWCLKRLGLRE